MNYRQYRSKPGWKIIDNKIVYLDSKMEATIIEKLLFAGFSLKWRRTFTGLASGTSHYTPDIELSILHDSMARRAIVELKPNEPSDFPYNRRRAMLASSHYYNDAICMLYVKHTNQWYILEPDGKLQKTPEPQPSGININRLPKPRFSVPILLTNGRIYRSRPIPALGSMVASGIQFGNKVIFNSRKH